MKRFILGTLALMLIIELSGCGDKAPIGISSGTYKCASAFGNVDLVLYTDGKATHDGYRGYWEKYGDNEATVIKESWVLRYEGDNQYTFRGTRCTKVE